jgi:CBS domain-containing protein
MSNKPNVAAIMTSAPIAIRADERVGRAAREMQFGSFRHLPVVDAEGHVVGVVSQRDVLGARDSAVMVRDIMTVDVKSVRPETMAHEAAYLLLRHRIGCVPVLDDAGRLVGIVTESDFVRVAYAALGGTIAVEELAAEELEGERS